MVHIGTASTAKNVDLHLVPLKSNRLSMIPRQGAKGKKPTHRTLRVTVSEVCPDGVRLPNKVYQTFLAVEGGGRAKTVSASCAFPAPLDSHITVHDLNDEIYALLSKVEQTIIDKYSGEKVEAEGNQERQTQPAG